MITASRLLYGMADEGVVPRAFRRVHPTRRTPLVAIVFTTLVAAGLIATGDLEALADTTVVLLLCAFVAVNAAVLVARRDPVEHDHFTVPRIVPVLGLLTCAFLLVQQDDPAVFLRAGLLLAVGIVLWLVNLLVARRAASR